MSNVSRTSQIHAEIIAEAYNVRCSNESGRFSRMDANDTMALALSLEQMRTRVYETEYAPLKARQYFNVVSDVDTGAESYAFEVLDWAGEAKVIAAGHEADDLPTVTAVREKAIYEIVSVGDSYRYTLQDIRRAAFMGRPLSPAKALAARSAYERAFDRIAAFGEAGTSITAGLAQDPNVATEALASVGTFAAKAATPQAILNDLNALVRAIVTDSKEVYAPDTVLLPTDQYMLVSQTRMAADTDQTVLQAFLSANPFVQRVDMWNRLDGAGASSADRAMAFSSSPETHEIVEPQPFEVLPPQARNLAFVVPCHGRTAGGRFLRPLSAKYMDGI